MTKPVLGQKRASPDRRGRGTAGGGGGGGAPAGANRAGAGGEEAWLGTGSRPVVCLRATCGRGDRGEACSGSTFRARLPPARTVGCRPWHRENTRKGSVVHGRRGPAHLVRDCRRRSAGIATCRRGGGARRALHLHVGNLYPVSLPPLPRPLGPGGAAQRRARGSERAKSATDRPPLRTAAAWQLSRPVRARAAGGSPWGRSCADGAHLRARAAGHAFSHV